MAKDEPIRVLGLSDEMPMTIANLTRSVSFIVVASLCRLKLTGAAAHYGNDQKIRVLPIKSVRSESSCVSAGRTLTLTKDGRVAVPMLNPTDKEKVTNALPAFTELVGTT